MRNTVYNYTPTRNFGSNLSTILDSFDYMNLNFFENVLYENFIKELFFTTCSKEYRLKKFQELNRFGYFFSVSELLDKIVLFYKQKKIVITLQNLKDVFDLLGVDSSFVFGIDAFNDHSLVDGAVEFPANEEIANFYFYFELSYFGQGDGSDIFDLTFDITFSFDASTSIINFLRAFLDIDVRLVGFGNNGGIVL